MQRALRLNIIARNRSLKSQRRKSAAELKEEQHQIRNETVESSRINLHIVRTERKHRREDWTLGPLAPNRLAGKNAGGYGQLDYSAIKLPPVLESERAQYFNIAVNDRVVVRTGREKGKIGKVNDIDEERQCVMLENVNMVSFLALGWPLSCCEMDIMHDAD
jgi:large subunit ribosomal protein L24